MLDRKEELECLFAEGKEIVKDMRSKLDIAKEALEFQISNELFSIYSRKANDDINNMLNLFYDKCETFSREEMAELGMLESYRDLLMEMFDLKNKTSEVFLQFRLRCVEYCAKLGIKLSVI